MGSSLAPQFKACVKTERPCAFTVCIRAEKVLHRLVLPFPFVVHVVMSGTIAVRKAAFFAVFVAVAPSILAVVMS